MDAEHFDELSESTAMTTVTNGQPKGQLVAGRHGLQFTDIDGMWRFAQMVQKSGLAPRSLKGSEAILVALQMGSELGMSPMQSLQSVAVINGRPSVWGDAAIALVHKSGKADYVREWIDGEGERMTAHCEVKRKDCPHEHHVSFSWTDAKNAGLANKDTYRQYPRRMLQMRARAFALRDQFADVLCGFSVAEEVQDYPKEVKRIESGDPAPTDRMDAICDAVEADAEDAVDVEFDGPSPEEAPELFEK